LDDRSEGDFLTGVRFSLTVCHTKVYPEKEGRLWQFWYGQASSELS